MRAAYFLFDRRNIAKKNALTATFEQNNQDCVMLG